MRSPLPGQDPFIEKADGLWGDFHDKLIGELERELSARIPDHYVVRLNARSYIAIEEGPGSFQMVPDVSLERRPGDQVRRAASENISGGGTTTLSAPVVMHAPAEVEQREPFIEIFGLNPDRHLVTGIEILSPSNKRPGTPGWDEYFRKRSAFLKGAANFVEIDLFREGRRMPMRESWPESPYYVLVSRSRNIPACDVWPAYSLIPLPDIPIPLEGDDADIVIRLQRMVEAIYERAKYAREVDYSSLADVGLSPEERDFLNAVRGTGKGI